MKKKRQTEVKFSIARINTEQFATLHVPQKEKANAISTELRFGVDPSQRLVAVFSKFDIRQEQKAMLVLEISCEFQLEKRSWESWKSGQAIRIPQNLMRHLSIITIGCARGVMHAKTENTPYAGFILPTVNLHRIIEEDLIIEAEPEATKRL